MLITKWRQRGRVGITCGFLVLALLLLVADFAQAQGEWVLPVCAEPYNFPVSSKDKEGFENRVAEIIADELKAELRFVWTALNSRTVRRSLLSGECDLIMGVQDGAMGLLTTVPYYRVAYVFVYRTDSGFDITSLDDEVLKELTISTYPGGPPGRALTNRGLDENLTYYRAIARSGGPDRTTPIIEAVMKGAVDVGIVYGPQAGYVAKHETDRLKVVPVSPQIDPPLMRMFRTWTIGVRPGDEALRDRLNLVLAERWDEIQAVLHEYGVPVLPTIRPVRTRAGQ